MQALPRIKGLYGSALGFAGGLVVTTMAAARPALGLVLLVAVVAAVSLCTTVAGAVLAALQCWAFYAGFMVGRTGEMVFDERTRWALIGLVQIAVLATAAAAASTALLSSVPARGRAAAPSPARS